MTPGSTPFPVRPAPVDRLGTPQTHQALAVDAPVAMDVAVMERLSGSVPGGRHVLVEGSGHNLHVDKPGALVAPVLSMVAGAQAGKVP